MIEQLVEANVISALEALDIEAAAVQGYWQISASGVVRSSDTVRGAEIRVTVHPLLKTMTEGPRVTMRMTVDIESQVQDDPDGAAYVAANNAVEAWAFPLVGAGDAVVALFSVAGFVCDGLTMENGDAGVSSQGENRVCSREFVIHGHLA